MLRRCVWFVAIYVASVAVVVALAYALKLTIRGMLESGDRAAPPAPPPPR
jgi:hypothetical protein